jgi:hypothetical protein
MIEQWNAGAARPPEIGFVWRICPSRERRSPDRHRGQGLGSFVQPAPGPAARLGLFGTIGRSVPRRTTELGLFGAIDQRRWPGSPDTASVPRFGQLGSFGAFRSLAPAADCRDWLCLAELACGHRPGCPRLGSFGIVGPCPPRCSARLGLFGTIGPWLGRSPELALFVRPAGRAHFPPRGTNWVRLAQSALPGAPICGSA